VDPTPEPDPNLVPELGPYEPAELDDLFDQLGGGDGDDVEE
jgi:hypothetical protein